MPDVVINGERVACSTAELRKMDALAAKAGKAREDFAREVLNIKPAAKKAAKKKKG